MTKLLENWKTLLDGDPILALQMHESVGITFKRAWEYFVDKIVFSSVNKCISDCIAEHCAEYGGSEDFIIHDQHGLYIKLEFNLDQILVGYSKDAIELDVNPLWDGGSLVKDLRKALSKAASWIYYKIYNRKMPRGRKAKKTKSTTQSKLKL